MSTLENHFSADVEIEHDGQTYRFRLSAQNKLVSRSNDWHSKGDPSSWLGVATFRRCQSLHPGLEDSACVELASAALGITRAKLIQLLRWNEDYVGFREGRPCNILDKRITE